MALLYEFKSAVERPLFDATKTAWLAEIESNPNNTSSSYYDVRFKQGEEAIAGNGFGDGGGGLCAVVKDGQNHADALIVVSYVKGQHLKMLDVTVRPSFDAADQEPNATDLAWIAATAIVGCLGMTYHHFPCNELKVRGSWPLDKDFLTKVTTAMVGIQEFAARYEASYHTNWIVLRKKQEAQ